MKRWLLFALTFLMALRSAFGVEFSTVKFAGKRITVCRVNVLTEPLELFLGDERRQPFKDCDAIDRWLQPQGRKLLFAMNAGMYHANYAPVGLFISHGRQLVPLNLSAGEGNFFLKPNGVFFVSTSGAHVVESSAFRNVREPVKLATQSGPLLVLNNRFHPAFRRDSDSRLFRNGVGIPSPKVALFVISEDPVNFHEFAAVFRDILHCPNALFFDGTVSSLFATALGRNDKKIDLGPIIGVTAAQ